MSGRTAGFDIRCTRGRGGGKGELENCLVCYLVQASRQGWAFALFIKEQFALFCKKEQKSKKRALCSFVCSLLLFLKEQPRKSLFCSF